MTKRIIISGSAFRVSVPGVSVDTATGSNIIFDAFSNNSYNGVYLKGLFPASQLVSKSGYMSGVVKFGKTFTSTPQAYVRITDGTSMLRDYFNQRASSSDGTNVIVVVAVDQLEVQIHYSGSTFNPNVAFTYVVFQR